MQKVNWFIIKLERESLLAKQNEFRKYIDDGINDKYK